MTPRDRLIEDHADRLVAYFYRRLGCVHQAEDMAQATILIVIAKWHKYDSDRPFWPWLVTIAFRYMVTVKRRKSAQPQATFEEGTTEGDARSSREVTSTLERMVREEDHARLRRAITDLPPSQRESIMLFYFERLSVKEITEILGVSPGRVYGMLSEARDRLMASLGDLAPVGR